MMQYELSISPSYVPDWTELEAIREIFQNSLDQEAINSDNKMSWEWSREDLTLIISSKGSKLTKETILFGSTTKANDETQIGCFGEGYKLALLVLSRLGYNVEIHNYQEKEKWYPVIGKSKKYGVDILSIYVKKFRFSRVPDSDLTFVIEGVSPELFNRVGHSNLHLYKPKNFEEVHEGRILFDGRCRGKLYVNGLYICERNGLRFGYDIKPRFLSIGRDRKLVDDFDLLWVLGRMWAKSKKIETAIKLIKQKSPDVKYLKESLGYDNKIELIIKDEFTDKYGDRAIPVSNQEEYDRIKNNYRGIKPVFVGHGGYHYISNLFSKVYEKADIAEKFDEPYELMEEFFKKYKYTLNSLNMGKDFQILLGQSKKWRWSDELC